MGTESSILLVTGAMAAGKSTIAQSLSEKLNPSVHLRGDVFRRMIVNGRVEMTANPSEKALHQLLLRYRVAAAAARVYNQAGFSVVYQDVIVGPILTEVAALYRNMPLHVIVLCPSTAVIIEREAARGKTGYGGIAVKDLQNAIEQTPPIGYWIDNSELSVEQTTQSILKNLDAAKIDFQ